MQIQHNLSVQDLHTFGVKAQTKYFVSIQSISDLHLFVQHTRFNDLPKLILGGGSNLLFLNDFEGVILKNDIRGIEIVEQTEQKAIVRVGGGENWHEFVLWCIEQGLGGVENLSLIPGTVGAAPIQNIGAYGVELKSVMTSLEAFHLSTASVTSFSNQACQFGYRDSVFKNQYKGQYFITSVTFELTTSHHQLKTNYGAIQKQLATQNILNPTIKNISDAVIEIRSSKLPDPKVLGNSGSFFKNPVVDQTLFSKIQFTYPSIPHYPMPNNEVKIPAGWLIEQCGWKGKRVGNTGAYRKQALVLVNYGNATGAEVKHLANAIQKSVLETFGIKITPEVNLI